MHVALYARVSTGSEEQEQALQQQLTRLRDAAKGETVHEFIDVASGSKDDRPQLQALLKACRSGQVDRVIVTRLDRMSRSMAHGAQLLAYFSAPDTPNLVALDDSLDLSTIGGRLVARMLINLGQAESERLSERVMHGKHHQRDQRKPFGPYAPYGYRFTEDKSNYELDPETAGKAREVIEHFMETGQTRETLRLARKLQAPFTSTAGLMTWMLNPTLYGCRCYGRSMLVRDEDGHLRRKQRPVGSYAEVIPDSHEPLITALEHAKVRAIYEQHKDRRVCGMQKRFVRELTGLVKCGHCGRTMSYRSGRSRDRDYLRCNFAACSVGYANRIRGSKVKAAIWDDLQTNWELVAMIAEGEAVYTQADAAQMDELLDAIRELEAKQDPDLAEAIAKKKQRLQDVMAEQQSQRDRPEGQALRAALQDERYWELAKSDVASERRMFVQHVHEVVVKHGEVAHVQLRVDDRFGPSPSTVG